MKGALTANAPAVCMLIRKDGNLLFVMRSNTGFMDGYYSLPGGRVEPDEAFLPAAVREAFEEVGVTVRPEDAKQVYTQHRYSQRGDQKIIWVDVFFEATAWSGDPYNAEPDQHSEFVWLPEDNLPENVMPYMSEPLRCLKQGQTYGEFGWPTEAQRP